MMKKLLPLILLAGMVTTVSADIQAPPKDRYNSVRKLSRGLANIVYGLTEVPASMVREHQMHGQSTEIAFYGFINGLERAGNRFAYGFYEVVNFRKPLYKDSFRAPYKGSYKDLENGYSEFPPQIGYLSTADYVRSVSY